MNKAPTINESEEKKSKLSRIEICRVYSSRSFRVSFCYCISSVSNSWKQDQFFPSQITLKWKPASQNKVIILWSEKQKTNFKHFGGK